MRTNNFTPAYPAYTKNILKDGIEYREISQRKFVYRMGLRYSVVNDILKEHRPLTEKTALMFEPVLNIQIPKIQ